MRKIPAMICNIFYLTSIMSAENARHKYVDSVRTSEAVGSLTIGKKYKGTHKRDSSQIVTGTYIGTGISGGKTTAKLQTSEGLQQYSIIDFDWVELPENSKGGGKHRRKSLKKKSRKSKTRKSKGRN